MFVPRPMRCIFCLKSDPPTGFTDEHVFPEGVGGTVTVPVVCKVCNDRLGHSVDVTVTNHTLVAMKRHLLGIPGKSGAIPNPFERGVLADDPTHKVRLDLSKPPPAAVYTVPFVHRIMTEPGKGTIAVRIDSTDAHRLGDILNTALKRAGVPPVSEEVVEELKNNVISTEKPVLSIPLSFDVSEYRRGLMKIVYELACRWIGDSYVDDPVAELLRGFTLDVDLPFDPSERYPIHGTMRMAPKEPFLPFWPQERDHLMGFLLHTDGRIGIQVSVLGVLDANVAVTNSPERFPKSGQHFISINPLTGLVRESSFEKEAERIQSGGNTSDGER